MRPPRPPGGFVHNQTRRVAGAILTGAFVAATALPAFALSVTVNGQPATFNPPPIERAGRVFVPLRGVFERLGATVVYQSGTINATGNNTTVSLRIGSNQATVNGQQRTLDTPPFIVGASTYVPLRFVSEALGAGVNYDGTNQIVALTTGGGSNGQPQNVTVTPVAVTPGAATNVLDTLEPRRGAFAGAARPTISANFRQNVDPNSVRISVDGLDVTQSATRSTTGFIFAPQSPLQAIRHHVEVTGSLRDGQTFREGWDFTSGSNAPDNFLTIESPRDGDAVPSSFTIRGKTTPNADVHIVGGATASLGGVFAFGAGNYTGDLRADGNGNFSQQVNLQTVGGATIGMTITSTDPQTKASAEKKLRLRAQ